MRFLFVFCRRCLFSLLRRVRDSSLFRSFLSVIFCVWFCCCCSEAVERVREWCASRWRDSRGLPPVSVLSSEHRWEKKITFSTSDCAGDTSCSLNGVYVCTSVWASLRLKCFIFANACCVPWPSFTPRLNVRKRRMKKERQKKMTIRIMLRKSFFGLSLDESNAK